MMDGKAAMASARRWSKQQQDIFKWFKSGKGNLIVRARAGTGKTTTILEAINHAPEQSILLVAFNKTIAVELTQKLANPRAEAKTLNALGNKYVTFNWRGAKLDTERDSRLALRVCGDGAPDAMVGLTRRLANLGKGMCPFATPAQLEEIAYDFDLVPDADWEDAGWGLDRVVRSALAAMQLAQQRDGTYDFNDQIYLPIVYGWVRPFWNLVVVDEAQDMNAAQLMLARKACKPGGRIVLVGDDRQAIYRFRGADSNAIDRMKEELKAEELGLKITYRCPRLIVEHAQKLVPDYEAAPGCPEGTISTIAYEKLAESVVPGDFVLSRKNAPLAGACLSILRLGKPAKISGKDIQQQLLSLVTKWKGDSLPRFLEKLTRWEERELIRAGKLPKEKQEAKQQVIRDQADTIRALSDGCSGVSELRRRIESMFVDEKENPTGVVLCSSIHKAKGQERDRVFLFGETLYPGKGRSEIEEANLEYVGVTRAKKDLIWVTGVK